VYGSTDERGGFVKDNPVSVADLVATLYTKLGIDPDKEYVSNIGRPVKIGNNGKPLHFLMT
jgi:arylsulfatase A-like enzyme